MPSDKHKMPFRKKMKFFFVCVLAICWSIVAMILVEWLWYFFKTN